MRIIYQCEICTGNYNTPEEARACEAKTMRDMEHGGWTKPSCTPVPGDVVLCGYPAYGWWKGDPEWSEWREEGGRFLDGYWPRWVVVHKYPEGRRHEWRYALWTPSDAMGDEIVRWTGPGHNRMIMGPRKATPEEMNRAQAFVANNYASLHMIPLM